MPFNIELVFGDGLTITQQQVFRDAAARWSKVITGDIPGVRIDGELIDDLQIIASAKEIDGEGEVLGEAGPEYIREVGSLPITGIMEFDTADLAEMVDDGSLLSVIIHEMGHVIGLGTIWEDLELIEGAGTDDPVFVGALAMQAYAELLGEDEPQKIPVENTGGPGTADGHWRESVFLNELMTGFVETGANPLSKLTIAALQDMGYEVNLDAADLFSLEPSPFESFGIAGHRCGMKCPRWKKI